MPARAPTFFLHPARVGTTPSWVPTRAGSRTQHFRAALKCSVTGQIPSASSTCRIDINGGHIKAPARPPLTQARFGGGQTLRKPGHRPQLGDGLTPNPPINLADFDHGAATRVF
ncbi:hypothetical protein GCM10010176_066890 [Nonomuraea spiralis]|nr:hypothetical protein GCM10010176_066890 [Nonomuraea spiralis]